MHNIPLQVHHTRHRKSVISVLPEMFHEGIIMLLMKLLTKLPVTPAQIINSLITRPASLQNIGKRNTVMLPGLAENLCCSQIRKSHWSNWLLLRPGHWLSQQLSAHWSMQLDKQAVHWLEKTC